MSRFWLIILAALTACGTTSTATDTASGEDATADTAATDAVSGDIAVGTLKTFTPPTDPGAGGFLFTTSGEVLALGGYAFPPTTASDPAFVDGWDIHFTRFIVTFDHLQLSDNPDKMPTDESKTDGVVAHVDGPWAVDLHKGGPLQGKGGSDEQAVAVAAIGKMDSGKAFDPQSKYAFSFASVPATASAFNVNLDAADLAVYATMTAHGYTTWIEGDATWKAANCKTTDTKYDFSVLPKTVHFALGLAIPTQYLNCQNPDLGDTHFDGEEHPRGVSVLATASAIAQVTFHTDHSFWESFIHDSPMHFDPMAAVAHDVNGVMTVTAADFVGQPFQPFVDKNKTPMPWRWCVDAYTPPNQAPMSFDTQNIPVSAKGDPTTTLRDIADYTNYNTSTQGHLNSDGLCFVQRNYPSPK